VKSCAKKYRNSKHRKSEFQFSDSLDIGISKKNPTGIFGIKNGIGIPLTKGVPEIGTKNQNSQSPAFPNKERLGLRVFLTHGAPNLH
jgi:hypothetical protein